MANTYKVLGQVVAVNTTDLATLYTVPVATSAIASTLLVCNQTAAAQTFKVAVRPAGAAIDAKHYNAYDTDIPANDSIPITVGMTLATTDVVSVGASSTSVSFNLYGSEIT